MKKSIAVVIFGLFITLTLLPYANAANAAVLKFSPTSKTVNAGDTFDIQVMVDAGTDEVSGTDAYILYDSSILQAQSVSEGTYFPYVTKDIADGKVSVWGVVTDAATSRTGSGTLATITFKATQSGSATLQYYCDLNASDTSKIVKNDINATNIIVCSNNDRASITVTSSTTGGGTTPTPTGGSGSGTGATPTPTGTGSSSTGGATSTPVPTELPRTGGASNLGVFAVTGTVLFVFGALALFVM